MIHKIHIRWCRSTWWFGGDGCKSISTTYLALGWHPPRSKKPPQHRTLCPPLPQPATLCLTGHKPDDGLLYLDVWAWMMHVGVRFGWWTGGVNGWLGLDDGCGGQWLAEFGWWCGGQWLAGFGWWMWGSMTGWVWMMDGGGGGGGGGVSGWLGLDDGCGGQWLAGFGWWMWGSMAGCV